MEHFFRNVTQEAKEWWIQFKGDMRFFDISYATEETLKTPLEGFTLYEFYRMPFETEEAVLHFVATNSKPETIELNLSVALFMIEKERAKNTGSRQLNIRSYAHTLTELYGPMSEMNKIATEADAIFIRLESGDTPNTEDLKLFMDTLVDFLEKQGAVVDYNTKEEQVK